MRGTPSFVGSRLREAREARGVSASSLADLIGKSRQAISQYENDHQTPAPDVMELITQRLDFPPQFFLRRVTDEEELTAVFYRSMSAATKAARVRAERRYLWLRLCVQYLRRVVDFPNINIPQYDMPDDPTQIGEHDIEEKATAVRRHLGLQDGPISDLALLLENNGVVVVRQKLGADKLDAFSEWNARDHRPYVVLGTEKASAVRSRFDAAHELGHLILHRNIAPSALANKTNFSLIEKQAHRFAGAFLLPAATFADESWLSSLDAFKSLKAKWHVSIQAMLTRAANLGLVTERRQEHLWRSLSRRGWRTREPFDDEFEPEYPRLLRRSIDLLLDNGMSPAHDLETEFGLRARDIESVLGIPDGYLTGDDSVKLLRFPAPRASKTGASSETGAPVIRFPDN